MGTNNIDWEKVERVSIDAALLAGEYIKKNAFGVLETEFKGGKKKEDPVTQLDREAEQLIKQYFEEHHPANYLGEEYGLEDKGSEITAIIDPIDGTKSFVLQEFDSAVSIGIEDEQRVLQIGVVYDFMKGIMYVANPSETYRLVGFDQQKRISLTIENPLSNPRIILDGSRVPKHISSVVKREPGFKVSKFNGGIALKLAQIASGTYSGMITKASYDGSPWDIAAGYCILERQGYKIYDVSGKPATHRVNDNGIIVLRSDLEDKLFPRFFGVNV